MRKKKGPRILPVVAMPTAPPVAMLMPMASAMGMTMPCWIVSPIPAIGPIRPVLTLLMASSLMSAPAARSSSIAMTAPWITPPMSGWVLKKTKWRFSAALMSSLVLYNFSMMGVMLCAKPIPCMRSQL